MNRPLGHVFWHWPLLSWRVPSGQMHCEMLLVPTLAVDGPIMVCVDWSCTYHTDMSPATLSCAVKLAPDPIPCG